MRANVFTMSLFVSVFWIGQCSVHAGERYHVWETVEISLNSQRHYANPYTDVDVWLRLKGPNFDRKVYGFWDGGDTFRVRVVGTKPGTWTWTSDSNQNDSGLNNQSGSFIACFPNWGLDDYSSYVKDDAGVEIRRAWQKPGTAGKCMDMHDEMGNRPPSWQAILLSTTSATAIRVLGCNSTRPAIVIVTTAFTNGWRNSSGIPTRFRSSTTNHTT